MKTSKILLPGIFALMFLTTCQKEEPVAENVSIEFEKDKIYVNGGMNTVECTVTAQGTWNITSSYDWISCDKQSVAGKETIQIKIATNTAYDTNHHEETDRGGFLVFTSNSVRKSIWIHQSVYDKPSINLNDHVCLGANDKLSIFSDNRYPISATIDKPWAHIETTSNSYQFDISFDKNPFMIPDSANIHITDGHSQWNFVLYRLGTLIDCQGNEYQTTRIGNRYWISTHLRTTKYDTNSPQTGKTIFSCESWEGSDGPVCVDIDTYKSSFDFTNKTYDYPVNQIGKLYNFAAAYGLTNNEQEIDLSVPQQGICPNGWHIATWQDWKVLNDYLETKNASALDYGLYMPFVLNGNSIYKNSMYYKGNPATAYWFYYPITLGTTTGKYYTSLTAFSYYFGNQRYATTIANYLSHPKENYCLTIMAVYDQLAE